MVAIHQWTHKGDSEGSYFIAVPTNTDVNGLTALSVASAAGALAAEGITYELAFQLGNCHVDDARNTLVARFLETKHTHLVFIDSDIVFTPYELRELIDADKDAKIVGASYPYKDDSGDFPGHFEQTAFADPDTGLVPIDGLPTGFLRIDRSVFDTIEAPHFYSKTEPGKEVKEFFRRSIDQGTRIGGDIHFCKEAKRAGIQCWLSPKIVLGHSGCKTWYGSWYWKQSVMCKGYYPSLREAFIEERWENQQVMNDLALHWGNGNYQGSSSYIQAAVHLADKFAKDKPILEMGGGLSSLFLALQATKSRSKLIVLEEDRMWMGKTWGAIQDLGDDVLSHTDVRHVPTVENEYNVDKDTYDTRYGLVCVDGPCGDNNKNGRRQALKFDSDAYLFDDANRPQILDTVRCLEEKGYVSKFVGADRGRLILLVVRGDLCD